MTPWLRDPLGVVHDTSTRSSDRVHITLCEMLWGDDFYYSYDLTYVTAVTTCVGCVGSRGKLSTMYDGVLEAYTCV